MLRPRVKFDSDATSSTLCLAGVAEVVSGTYQMEPSMDATSSASGVPGTEVIATAQGKVRPGRPLRRVRDPAAEAGGSAGTRKVRFSRRSPPLTVTATSASAERPPAGFAIR